MLQLTQRTSAPSSTSVSMSTAVCTVMCSEPMIFAPARGFFPLYSARRAMSPGISYSARRISFRPNSASERSFTLNDSRPAVRAASSGCGAAASVAIGRLSAVSVGLLFVQHGGKVRRSLRVCGRGQRREAARFEASLLAPARELFFTEAEPDVTHRLPVFGAVVRHHVHDQHACVLPERAMDAGERERRLGGVVQHQREDRHVEFAGFDRERFERSLPHAAAAPPPPTPRLATGAIASASWPVPQPRSPTVQRGSSRPRSAKSSVREPKSSARSLSHCAALEAKNCCEVEYRAAITLRTRSASRAAVAIAPTSSRTDCQRRRALASSSRATMR